MKSKFFVLAITMWQFLLTLTASGQVEDESAGGEDGQRRRPLNIVGPTLGGKQFWSDELVFGQWRIQRNVVTNHYRLLDGRQYRHAWGEYEDCVTRLNEIKQQRGLSPMRGKAVILLHGIVRSRSSMAGMARYLRKSSDYTVINVSYASTREPIARHAATLGRLVERLEGIEEINFVAHSMGNLVIRHYLHDTTDAAKGKTPDPRIRRIVMLAPPNNGTRMARAFKDNEVFRLLWGISGKELAEWPELQDRLATPACQFGIVAGDRAAFGAIGNPLFDDKNDFVVSVEETRLIGARDFAVLPVLHSSIMDDETVREYTLRFLRHGYFISEEARQPINEIASQKARRQRDD